MVNNIIDLKNKPHAILLVESKLCNLEDFIKKYISSIIDSNKGNNAQLNGTVPYNNYFDIIKINDYEANIKKESIINLINEFSKSSVEEKGFKFYVIYGIEYATAQAINSLLKFLEEPPQNTYAILTTRALNLVLPTVRSRCHVYILKSDFNTFATKIAEFHLSKEQTKIIEQVYFNYDEIINDLKNNLFQNIYELVTSWINAKNDLEKIKQLKEQFSKLNYRQIELVLKMLSTIFSNNESLLNLLNNLHLNPIKILLFNNIWTILQNYS